MDPGLDYFLKMHKSQRNIGIATALCMYCHVLVSQPNQALFTQFTTDDGLSSNTVTAIHQDRLGYMWFRSFQGLDRYDGIEFLNYPTGQEELGYCIAEDSLGNLWYGSSLTVYDQAADTHYQNKFFHQGDQADIGRIIHIAYGPDHLLYLATEENIFLKDPYAPDSILKSLFPEEMDLPFQRIAVIRFDPQDRLWIASDAGLYWYQPGMESPVPFVDLEYPEIRSIQDFLIDRNGDLWAVFNQSLIHYYLQHDTIFHYNLPDEKQAILSTAYQSENGTIWLGTSGNGLFYLEPGQDRFKRLLDQSEISTIYEDHSHRIWIGTETKGIFLFDSLRTAFSQLPMKIGDQALASYSVSKIVNDEDKGLWVKSQNLGFLYYDLHTGNAEVIDQDNNNNELLYRDGEGKLWYQTQDHLLRYNPHNGSVRKIKISTPLQTSTPGNGHTFTNMCAFQGRLILSSDYGNVFAFDPVAESFSLILQNNGPVRALMPEKDTLYLGLYSVGVVLVNSGFRIIDTIDHEPGDPGLLYQAVMTMHKDRMDDLWIGGIGGISRLNPNSGKFDKVYDSQGSAGHIVSILEDQQDNLWFGTNNGLCKFDRRNQQFTLLGINHGVPEGRFSSGCAVQTPDGQMYFGGNMGIVQFSPEEIRLNTEVPQVVLTGFQVNSSKAQNTYGESRNYYQEIRRQGEIHLKYWQNAFTLRFASLNYTSPQHNLYQYRMLGLEEQWNRVGNRSYASYTDLAGGNYIFEVMGSNNDGVWNLEARSFIIHIDPAPSRSWWAFSLYALLLLSLILSIYFYRIRRIRLQYQLEVKTTETESLQEIDQAKSKFFANVSHEFRTPLTLILDPAEQLLREEGLNPRQKEYINLILKNSRQLLSLTNQILDLTKLSTSQIKLRVEEVDLSLFIAPISHAFKSKAEALEMDYTISLPDRPLKLWIDKEKTEQIIVNLLGNAFKFCPPGGKIALRITEETETVSVLIEDSGIGIPADQVDHIFEKYYQVDSPYTRDMAGTGIGLFLVRELVNLHHGHVDVKSEAGKGSTFSVHFLRGHSHFKADQLKGEPGSTKKDPLRSGEMIPAPKQERNPIPDPQLPSLLIIEDNHEMAQYLTKILSDEYTMHTVMNGVEGFQSTLDINPDLVISDVMMPLMDGYHYCHKVKHDVRTSHIPVILLTAKNMHRDKIAGFESGADDFLQKPFHTDELKLRIRYHLENRKKSQEEFLKKFRINAETDFALSVKEQFLQKIFSLNEAHLSDDQFGVEKLSELMGMSRKHLSHKIKSLTNQTPTELIRNFRLRKAGYLLSEQGVSVSEACYAAGFNSPSYFSKCFADFFGKRPSEYGN